MEYSFDDNSKCAEIAEVGDWLVDSLPKVTRHPEHFWNTNNLWRHCVCVDGKYTIERHRAMELMREQGFAEPANDLARPIAEAAFRLDYLLDDEDRLIDYARWQLLDCYHRVLKPVSQFDGIPAELKEKLDDEMVEVKAILGDRFSEKRPRTTWKNFEQLIAFESTVENRNRRQNELYIQTGVTLSRGLHNAWLSPVSPQYGSFAGRISFVMAMDRIGKICLNKKLVSAKGTNYAKRIVALCDVDSWDGQ